MALYKFHIIIIIIKNNNVIPKNVCLQIW